jgi:hypothetical protein
MFWSVYHETWNMAWNTAYSWHKTLLLQAACGGPVLIPNVPPVIFMLFLGYALSTLRNIGSFLSDSSMLQASYRKGAIPEPR